MRLGIDVLFNHLRDEFILVSFEVSGFHACQGCILPNRFTIGITDTGFGFTFSYDFINQSTIDIELVLGHGCSNHIDGDS
jgi:hypothetical protein